MKKENEEIIRGYHIIEVYDDPYSPNYNLEINGQMVKVIYSSYGVSLGWWRDQFIVFSSHDNNPFFVFFENYIEEEFEALLKGEGSYYDKYWGSFYSPYINYRAGER